uniref:Uncharacterized protein n=1 Tax=Trichuris muris TaxID=70415 RepID=A0A5S6QCZ5_TRIMR
MLVEQGDPLGGRAAGRRTENVTTPGGWKGRWSLGRRSGDAVDEDGHYFDDERFVAGLLAGILEPVVPVEVLVHVAGQQAAVWHNVEGGQQTGRRKAGARGRLLPQVGLDDGGRRSPDAFRSGGSG